MEMGNVGWNWALVANGTRSDTLNYHFAGMWRLSQTKMRPTVEDDDFVHCVDLQDIIKPSRAIVSVQGRVRTQIVCLDRRVGESGNGGNGLLDVAHALHMSDG